MDEKNINIVPLILSVVGLIADIIGIYTFWNMPASTQSATFQQFFPIAELILFYSGLVFVWYSFNRIDGSFSDFDSDDAKPFIPVGLFTVVSFPIQVWLCDTFIKALLIQIIGMFFFGLGGHLLYKWQHIKGYQ